MGSQNAGWFRLEQNANALLPMMGVGAALVIVAFAGSPLDRQLDTAGGLARAIRILLILGSLFNVLGLLIEFAIVGTLALGFGLICLSVAVTRRRLVSATDRVLIILSAIGSLTWNTETVSAFLLVGVGAIWMILSIRVLSGEHGLIDRA